jgi:hypothetical protein
MLDGISSVSATSTKTSGSAGMLGWKNAKHSRRGPTSLCFNAAQSPML